MTEVLDLSSRVLPQAVRYSNLTPLAVVGKSSKKKFFPLTAGPFTPQNNTVKIELASSTGFLDGTMTYLKFSVGIASVSDAKTVYVDGSASGIIKRLRISSKAGSSTLEDIANYNNLHSVISDLTLDNGYRNSLLNLSEGYGYINANDVTAGTGEGNFATRAPAGTITLKTFAVPLMSSILGTSSKKYLPLFLTGPILLEVEISSDGVYTSDDAELRANVSIKDVELHCEIVEFDQSINDALKSVALSSGIYLHGTSWRNYQRPIDNQPSQNLMINERLKSVKSFIMTFRLPPDTSTKRTLSRIFKGLTSLQLKVGDMLIPQQPISTAAAGDPNGVEFISELLKAVGTYGSTLNGGSVINAASWIKADAGLAASAGRYCVGIDLDNFKSQDVESGVNMVLNSPMNVMFTGTALAVICDIYLLYDCLYALRPDGTFTARY